MATKLSKTERACAQIAKNIRVLIEEGVTDSYEAMVAAMHLTPEGDTPERHAILAGLRREQS